MLEIKNLSAMYKQNKSEIEILSKVSFVLEKQKVTTLLGKNGCGKSTLLKCINQRLDYEGEITLNGINIKQMKPKERAKHISFLPQLLPQARITVRELVSMGRIPYQSTAGRASAEDKEAIEKAMSEMGVSCMAEKPVCTLSGGERQNAFVAMTLAQNTEIILFDEPTTYMDIENKAHFNKIVKILRDCHGKTILMVTHDITDALRSSDNILVLHKGKILFDGSAKRCIESESIERAFGVQKKIFSQDGETYAFYQ